ncbi:hypothetical protein [Algoriphagus boritolerans]|uniref:hypothetical protein n=1 Tax=Algoriphagus boritolerans TaxID=308111 RepID=UPI002FCE243F
MKKNENKYRYKHHHFFKYLENPQDFRRAGCKKNDTKRSDVKWEESRQEKDKITPFSFENHLLKRPKKTSAYAQCDH